jgi:enolase
MTIEVGVLTEYSFGRAAAPLGAPGSRGEFEHWRIPSGGVEVAIDLVVTLIKPELLGENALEQERLDALLREIDGTKNYRRIGGTRPW